LDLPQKPKAVLQYWRHQIEK